MSLNVFRYLVVLMLAGFWIWVIGGLGLFSISIAVLLLGTLLFSLNCKWADMISSVIFGLGLAASVAFVLEDCMKAESCWASGYEEPFSFPIQRLFITLWALYVLVLVNIALTLRYATRIR